MNGVAVEQAEQGADAKAAPASDIDPTPLGDSIVDVQDLVVLAEHLFEEFSPAQ